MNIIFTKEKVVKYKDEIIEVSDSLMLVTKRANSKITSQTLIEKAYLKIKKKKNTYKIELPKSKKRLDWRYFSPDIIDEIKTTHMTKINTDKYELDPFKELKKHGKLKEKNILWFDYSAHLVYRFKQDAPVSGIYTFDYIGGINNRDFHIEKAFKHLQKRKSVLKVEMVDIPYYNSESHYTKGLEMELILPQAALNKIWEEVKSDEFASVRLREHIIPKYWQKSATDPLGIKKFLRTEKEIKELENCSCSCGRDEDW